MRWLPALLLVVVSSCNFSLFTDQMAFPDDLPCSDANSCPPNEVCVPGEHYCRYPCNNGACPSGHMSGGSGLICDVDHFCRVGCAAGGSMPQNSCGTGQTCDNAIMPEVCRPFCGGSVTCGAGFTCELNSQQAGGCRPTP